MAKSRTQTFIFLTVIKRLISIQWKRFYLKWTVNAISILKFHFRVNQMGEICKTTIPRLQMDFAVFVVHAHESRLSINEDNAGIGYSKFYRALLGTTGEYNKKSVSLEKKIYLTSKKLIIHNRYVFESYKEMDLIRVRRQLDFQTLLKDNNKPTFALCNRPLVKWYLHSMHMSRRSKRKFVAPERVSPLSHF